MNTISKLLLAGSAAATLGVPMSAMAQAGSPHEITGNVGLFSQYIFRGLTQTDGKPALQGGFDYAHASGFYAGVWGSNISWLTDTATYQNGSYSVEIDTYLGFRFPVGDFTFDVGYLRYNYPGRQPTPSATKADTDEIYAGVSWKFVSFKYSYSLGDTFGVDDAKGSDYLDLTATLPIGNTGFNVIGHLGRQQFRGPNRANASYTDWRIAVAREFMGFNLSLGYSDTDATDVFYTNKFGRNVGKGTWTVGIQKSF